MPSERRWRSRRLESESDPLQQAILEVKASSYLSGGKREELRRHAQALDQVLQDASERKLAAIATLHELALMDPACTREERLSGLPRLFGEHRVLGMRVGRHKGRLVPVEPDRQVRRTVPMQPPRPELGSEFEDGDSEDASEA